MKSTKTIGHTLMKVKIYVFFVSIFGETLENFFPNLTMYKM